MKAVLLSPAVDKFRDLYRHSINFTVDGSTSVSVGVDSAMVDGSIVNGSQIYNPVIDNLYLILNS